MLHSILERVFPRFCLLCEQRTEESFLCTACRRDLPVNLHACGRCGLPLSSGDVAVCGACVKKPPVFDAARSFYLYRQPFIWMIQQLKYRARLEFAELLASLLQQQLGTAQTGVDCIIPVPLYPGKCQQRGFNQATEIIRPVAKSLGIPLETRLCRRSLDTDSQSGLNRKQRIKNIKNAFVVTPSRNYRSVVVFDDVMTTGSTLAELTRSLKRAGIGKVEVWSLARAETKR